MGMDILVNTTIPLPEGRGTESASPSQPHPPVPLYQPDLSGNERAYLLECIDSTWISSNGPFVARFENAFAEFVGAKHAIAVSNGTVALHVALVALGIGPGDEVIVPSFTYVASVNAIAYTGATPVFAESRTDDWLLDPDDVERKISSRTKAILPVHIYSGVCDILRLIELAKGRNIAIVEDAAEAIGSRLHGRHAGSFGSVGTFSFYGNKTITTGEGGMVVTNDASLADRIRLLKGQGQSPTRRYWHIERGFNYRMTNLCAAIGLAQLERVHEILLRKRTVAALYRKLMSNLPVELQRHREGIESGEWLMTVLLPDYVDRDHVILAMEKQGVETRPIFYCVHQMPIYKQSLTLPRAEAISRRGISLPTYPTMSEDDIKQVVSVLATAIRASE